MEKNVVYVLIHKYCLYLHGSANYKLFFLHKPYS